MNTLKVDALAFGAHPDDIELMCAGTLAKMVQDGFKVGICSLTFGEKGTRGTVEIRQKEFDAAAQLIGASLFEILGLPDGNVENNFDTRFKVIDLIRKTQPDVLIIPHWEMRHPDHAACSHLVREAGFYSGLAKIETTFRHHRPAKVFYYMEMYDFDPTFIVDISDTFSIKLAAIKAHKSQFWNPDDDGSEEETLISSPDFFESITTKAKYWGQKIGVEFGEPFYKREPLGIFRSESLLVE